MELHKLFQWRLTHQKHRVSWNSQKCYHPTNKYIYGIYQGIQQQVKVKKGYVTVEINDV